jgi:HEAT repeat protein
VGIKLSSSRNIDALIVDLGAARAATREAAVARLTIIGARAVERIVAVAGSSAPAEARTAALRALEAIGDPRGRAVILEALADADAAVASAAAAAASGYLHGPHGAEALDRLTCTALDRSRRGSVRAAALRAIGALDASTIAPLLDALREDRDTDVRAASAAMRSRALSSGHDPAAVLADAARGDLPPDADALRDAVVAAGSGAPLPDLLRLIEAVRAREEAEPPVARAGWTGARAAAHLVLATRGTRIALYDLRDSLSAADLRLPVEWLAALAAIGDATCLEPMAAAHARTADPWWREHVADAFRAIVKREGLTRRHAVLRKVTSRWGEALWAKGAGQAGKAGGAGRAGKAGR